MWQSILFFKQGCLKKLYKLQIVLLVNGFHFFLFIFLVKNFKPETKSLTRECGEHFSSISTSLVAGFHFNHRL